MGADVGAELHGELRVAAILERSARPGSEERTASRANRAFRERVVFDTRGETRGALVREHQAADADLVTERQYTASAGKTTNCQIGVRLVLASEHAHVATDFELYIPESWTADRERCRRAKIPDDVQYEPKWALALRTIERAKAAGLPEGIVLGDSDYGTKTVFRDMLDVLGLQYALEVQSTAMLRRIGKRDVPGQRMSVTELGVCYSATSCAR